MMCPGVQTELFYQPLTSDDTVGMRSSSPPWAQLLARHQRQRFKASWGLAETGAAGPSGNTYGDPAGHSCLARCSRKALTRSSASAAPARETRSRRC